LETYVRKGAPSKNDAAVRIGPPLQNRPRPDHHELRMMLPRQLAGFWMEWIHEIDSTSSAEVRKLIAAKLREVGKIE
jgi:hypothetical protein